MSTGAVVPFTQRVQTFRQLFDKQKAQVAIALPKHMDADRMLRVAMTAMQKTPKLFDCTPESVIECVMTAAQLGLEPNAAMGESYLIPFDDRKRGVTICTLIPGYQGLVKLAFNSGHVLSIEADVVHEGDHFVWKKGLDPQLDHVPGDCEDPAKVTHAYAIVRLKGGGVQWMVMSRNQVETVRAMSRAGRSGPWVDHWEAMAKKTVFRRLSKWIPKSAEMSRALELDDEADMGVPQSFAGVVEPEPAAPKDPKERKLTIEVEGQPVEREPGAEG